MRLSSHDKRPHILENFMLQQKYPMVTTATDVCFRGDFGGGGGYCSHVKLKGGLMSQSIRSKSVAERAKFPPLI